MASVDKFGKVIWEDPENFGNSMIDRYAFARTMEEELSEYDKVKMLKPSDNRQPVKIVLADGVKMPEYSHMGDAGFDLVNNGEEFTLVPGKPVIVKTGIKVSIPVDCQLEIRPRSGLAAKHGIMVLNSPGTLDSGYRNEIGVILFNSTKGDYRVKAGERIAQAVLMPFYRAVFSKVDTLDDSERGENGFGSTGE